MNKKEKELYLLVKTKLAAKGWGPGAKELRNEIEKLMLENQRLKDIIAEKEKVLKDGKADVS